MFILDAPPKATNNISSTLKSDVEKSLKEHINNKIPYIIKIVGESYKRSQLREKRCKAVHAESQTVDNQSNKLTEMRRKLAQSESTAVSCKAETEKLEWTVKEKEMIIGKIEKEITQLREEYNSKSYSYQKEVKGLEDKCKRYKDQIERQRSKLEYTQREYSEVANTMKTTKTFQKLKEVTLVDQQ